MVLEAFLNVGVVEIQHESLVALALQSHHQRLALLDCVGSRVHCNAFAYQLFVVEVVQLLVVVHFPDFQPELQSFLLRQDLRVGTYFSQPLPFLVSFHVNAELGPQTAQCCLLVELDFNI